MYTIEQCLINYQYVLVCEPLKQLLWNNIIESHVYNSFQIEIILLTILREFIIDEHNISRSIKKTLMYNINPMDILRQYSLNDNTLYSINKVVKYYCDIFFPYRHERKGGGDPATHLVRLIAKLEGKGFKLRYIHITGHSLGGALATLAALDLHMFLNDPSNHALVTPERQTEYLAAIRVFTLGAPHVGDDA